MSSSTNPVQIAIVGPSGLIGLRHLEHVLAEPTVRKDVLQARSKRISPDYIFRDGLETWLHW